MEVKHGVLRKVRWDFMKDREIHMVRAMRGVQLKDRKRSKDFMLMLGLNETIDLLAMANSVHWYGHVLRREDGHVLRMALDLEVEAQRLKWRKMKTWLNHVERV